MLGSDGGRYGGDGDVVAEVAQLADGVVARSAAAALVKVGGDRLLGALTIAQHVVDNDQQAVAEGNAGFLPAAAGHKPPIVAGQTSHPFQTGRDADAGGVMSRLEVACFPAGSHRRWCHATPRSNGSAGSSHQTQPDLAHPPLSRQRSAPPYCPFSYGDGRGAPRGPLA